MSAFDFIIDNIRFSYSSLSTYETCPYSFRLTYLDKCERINNFFAQYGNLVHECIFQYFKNDLETYELSGYYKEHYDSVVEACPPAYPPGMEERYKDDGLTFFNNFNFDLKNYEILLVEEKIDFDFDDNIQFVAKPDLVLFEKSSGDFILLDYKTSAPFRIDKRNGKELADTKKLDGYYKQMYLYCYALRNYKMIPIDKITLWFTRPDRQVTIPWKEKEEIKAVKWLEKTVKSIKADEKFKYHNENPYFCDNLCGVRMFCEYRLSVMNKAD